MRRLAMMTCGLDKAFFQLHIDDVSGGVQFFAPSLIVIPCCRSNAAAAAGRSSSSDGRRCRGDLRRHCLLNLADVLLERRQPA
jgi:hypothetical protein